MAITGGCSSLNLSPPPASSSRATNISWKGNWRNQCVAGMASSCVIIGLLQLGDASAVVFVGERPVIGKADTHVLVSKPRWSDKRMCPSWRSKSFEIIVPENLPRRSARRRWEAIGYTKPAAKVTFDPNCFSM